MRFDILCRCILSMNTSWWRFERIDTSVSNVNEALKSIAVLLCPKQRNIWACKFLPRLILKGAKAFFEAF